MLNFKADGGDDDSIVLIDLTDCLNGSDDHGVLAAAAPSPALSLDEVFEAVGVQRADIEALIAEGFVDPDAIDMLYGQDFLEYGPVGAGVSTHLYSCERSLDGPLGREYLLNLPVRGFHYIALHILWITAPLGQKGRHLLLILAGRRGVRIILKIVSITGIPLTMFFFMICGTGHT